MAMETNPAGLINVSPVQAPKSVSSDGISRKIGDSSGRSAFQPQTNVNIKSSIEDITGLLSKVASTENMTANKLPQELQKMIQTMLQNSFSLESTLAQGMGSSMESQRFTLEQLSSLSRMLTQLGTVAEQGAATTLPDTLQALLSSLKALDGADGKLLDSVHLNKLAFQLLDSQSMENLPVELQVLLGGATGQSAVALPAEKAESFAFLKQLIQYFMPAAPEASPVPGEGDSNATFSQNQAGSQSGGQNNAPGSMQNSAVNTSAAQTNVNGANVNRNVLPSSNQPGLQTTGTAPAAEMPLTPNAAVPQQPGMATAPPAGGQQMPGTAQQPGLPEMPGTGQQTVLSQPLSGTAQPAGSPQQQQQGPGQQASGVQLQQPLGNSPQTGGAQQRCPANECAAAGRNDADGSGHDSTSRSAADAGHGAARCRSQWQ